MALGELDDRASVDSGDGGSNADDGIWPDDSASTCGLSRAAKGRLRERELTQLRQLVEKDDRFGRTLEKTTLAVHQLVADGNPSPALVLLASLVWQSLCLAWEVDAGHGTGKGLPKAQLRAQTTQLEDEVRQLKDDFARARSQYLKELRGEAFGEASFSGSGNPSGIRFLLDRPGLFGFTSSHSAEAGEHPLGERSRRLGGGAGW